MKLNTMRSVSLKIVLMVLFITGLFCFNWMTASDAYASDGLSRPVISSLKSDFAGKMRVSANHVKTADGYQIKYNLGDGSNKKVITLKDVNKVSGKTISDLTQGRTYYVRVRAYRIDKIKIYKTVTKYKTVKKGKKKKKKKYTVKVLDKIEYKTIYSDWSEVKTISIFKVKRMYINHKFVKGYSQTAHKGSYLKINYRTPVLYSGIAEYGDTGYWQKIRYADRYYYIWQKTEKGSYSNLKSSIQSDSDMLSACKTQHQKEAVELALELFHSGNTAFVGGGTLGVKLSNGKLAFDCVGLIAYILNETVEKDMPLFHMNGLMTDIYNLKYGYNYGYDSEFKSYVVCKGDYDYSKMRPGDVLLFDEYPNDGRAYNHTAMYLGGKEMIMIRHGDQGAEIMTTEHNYRKKFVCAIRVMADEYVPVNQTKTLAMSTSLYNVKECTAPSHFKNLSKGTEVKILYTTKTKAYVEYEEGEYAFIKGLSGRFEE